ncbi:MAG: hypothetical protein L0212_04170 [Acidobacteria bacterium]|nr:hypothetical protein [Acidobacteriota bacterium]
MADDIRIVVQHPKSPHPQAPPGTSVRIVTVNEDGRSATVELLPRQETERYTGLLLEDLEKKEE